MGEDSLPQQVSGSPPGTGPPAAEEEAPPENKAELSAGAAAVPASEDSRQARPRDDDDRCPICLEAVALGPGQASEVLVLRCSHKIHLDCWLACTLPTISGGSGLDKYVENRVCRKCPMCRAEYSDETIDYVQELRGVVASASSRLENSVRVRAQAMLDKMKSKRARLHLEASPGDTRVSIDRELEALSQRMPLDDADVFAALMHPMWVNGNGRPLPFNQERQHRLTNFLRAELQHNGLSTSGERGVLIQRLGENDLITVGLFRELRDEAGLLTGAQPLRGEIDKVLSGSKRCLLLCENKKSQEQKLVNSVAEAVTREVLEQQLEDRMAREMEHGGRAWQTVGGLGLATAIQAMISGLPRVNPAQQQQQQQQQQQHQQQQHGGGGGGDGDRRGNQEEEEEEDEEEEQEGDGGATGAPRQRQHQEQPEQQQRQHQPGPPPGWPWEEQMAQLEAMGFLDRERCLEALSLTGGDVGAAAGILLNG